MCVGEWVGAYVGVCVHACIVCLRTQVYYKHARFALLALYLAVIDVLMLCKLLDLYVIGLLYLNSHHTGIVYFAI